MIYTVIVFIIFLFYVAYNEIRHKREFDRIIELRIDNEKRFNEFERYAYTDVRELKDVIDEVRETYVKK